MTRVDLVEEAMRRATREATTGPRELRSGRFDPYGGAKRQPAKS